MNLIENLKNIAVRVDESDKSIIEAAIVRLEELEAKLIRYEDDTTDWQASVETQMRRRTDIPRKT